MPAVTAAMDAAAATDAVYRFVFIIGIVDETNNEDRHQNERKGASRQMDE
jgi:predicted lipase